MAVCITPAYIALQCLVLGHNGGHLRGMCSHVNDSTLDAQPYSKHSSDEIHTVGNLCVLWGLRLLNDFQTPS